MASKNRLALPAALLAAALILLLALLVSAAADRRALLPAIFGNPPQMKEVRALWVTRFDWTSPGTTAEPAHIDAIVDNAARAGFNVLYFQVRGEADAFYASGLEPWSRRLSGTLGQDPGWDPLARLVERGHASGLQVHAYINVYPLWAGCTAPPEDTTPHHLYYKLRDLEGTTDGQLHASQWNSAFEEICDPYLRASPASAAFNSHLRAVVKDLALRYAIDGIHLDHIRYASSGSSCDPMSATAFGSPCFVSPDYADWQRQQVNAIVANLHSELRVVNPDLKLTAAVWPVYRDTYGWNVSSGYDSYYQDPQAWMSAGTIDGVSPMIYTGAPDCNRPYFWTVERWSMLAADYQAMSNGRAVVPGIGVAFCTPDDFQEIVARIEAARTMGVAGHAIFSYSGLLQRGYFDRLASGPYAVPAVIP